MNVKTKHLAFLGVMTAFTLVLSYIEAVLPPIYSAVPGVKAGLPNIIIIFLLYKTSVKQAAAVSLVRLLAVALLFGNAMTLIYSIAGAALSLVIMFLLKNLKFFSMVGVSIAGGVFHNIGQIIVASIVLETAEIGFYIPILAISGTLAGIVVGIIASILIKKSDKFKI